MTKPRHPRPWSVETGSSPIGDTGDSDPWVRIVDAEGVEVLVFYEGTATSGRLIDDLVAIAEQIRQAVNAVWPPARELEDKKPVVLYFDDEAQRADFMNMMAQGGGFDTVAIEFLERSKRAH